MDTFYEVQTTSGMLPVPFSSEQAANEAGAALDATYRVYRVVALGDTLISRQAIKEN